MKMVYFSAIGLVLSIGFNAAATDLKVSQACFMKAAKRAILTYLEVPMDSSFVSVRLGSFPDQGAPSLPYYVDGSEIVVNVSTSFSQKKSDGTTDEVKYTEFYGLKILNAQKCKLGPAINKSGD